MPAYDRSFTPPAAVADVSLSHPIADLTSGPLRGKLDSGADISVIPERWITPLGLSPRASVWARSYDGSYSQRAVYYVRFTIEGHELPAVRCLAANRDGILVGRNVLNRFVISLDGKRLRFTLRR